MFYFFWAETNDRFKTSIDSCEGGSSKDFRVCEQPECPQPRDLRARQCSRFFEVHTNSKRDLFDTNGTWLPYENFDGSPSCQLVCHRKETGEIFHTGLNVEDATPCSYETTDICVDVSLDEYFSS